MVGQGRHKENYSSEKKNINKPEKVDVRQNLLVLIFFRFAVRKSTEESVGEKACHLLLRHGHAVIASASEEEESPE